MALVLTIVPALQTHPTLRDVIAAAPQTPATLLPPRQMATPAAVPSLAAVTPRQVAIVGPTASLREATPTVQQLARLKVSPPVRALASPRQTVQRVTLARSPVPTVAALPPTRITDAAIAPVALAEAVPNISPIATSPPPAMPLTWREPPRDTVRAATAAGVTVAMLTPPGHLLPPLPAPSLDTTCPVAYGSATPPTEPAPMPASFGLAVAQAAAAQTAGFVIYDDRYRQISRTSGDVPALFGVCTDVVVRAYRSVGLDLQALVQASKLGSGDPNIDHRRTETLRRFLAKYGQSLPVSSFPEEYRPGDIVTYYRPQNTASRSHIAIVSDRLGPSGRPMIIHNRGWGPQLEDALFVDRITGHYRYDGSLRPTLPVLAATPPAALALRPSATPIGLTKPAPHVSAEPETKPTGL